MTSSIMILFSITLIKYIKSPKKHSRFLKLVPSDRLILRIIISNFETN